MTVTTDSLLSVVGALGLLKLCRRVLSWHLVRSTTMLKEIGDTQGGNDAEMRMVC